MIEERAIEQAATRVRQWLEPTPLIRSPALSHRLGAYVHLKLGTLQPTHSFKVRGAFNAMARLNDEQRRRGVVTASGGNHGLAVAYAAKALGIPATVYLPQSATEAKLAPLRRLGPEILIHGEAWDEANALALRVAAESGHSYVHPFDDPCSSGQRRGQERQEGNLDFRPDAAQEHFSHIFLSAFLCILCACASRGRLQSANAASTADHARPMLGRL
ncbi:MAG: threonine ammonia-lyase [Burkholderiales bacterium]